MSAAREMFSQVKKIQEMARGRGALGGNEQCPAMIVDEFAKCDAALKD